MAIQPTRQSSGAGRAPRASIGVGAPPRARRNGISGANRGVADRGEERLARALGWFSLGLGLPQLTAPGGFAQVIGVPDDEETRALLRVVGLREIAAGVGILTRSRPAGWLWARVAGDAMDLALLGSALTSKHAKRNRVTAATVAVVGVTALDLFCAVRLSQHARATPGRSKKEAHGMHVEKAITVNSPPEEAYRFWHDFENLPRFMDHLESVEVTGDRQSHWRAKAPAGRTVEWDAEIVDDRPNELIAWRSLQGASVDNSGSVRFEPAPGGRGTEIKVELDYAPPGGALGATIAKLFGEEPEQQVQEDLRRFKQVIETGEVVHSDATIHQRPHPAQPPTAPARA